MRACNVRFTVERRDFTRHAWGKTLTYTLMRTDETTMKSTTKKKGREEDELAFKGTVEPFYSSAHPVTPAVLHRLVVVLVSFRVSTALRVQIYHFCAMRATRSL
mmetsp:Transcript_4848/g.16629  ORF Transcript_4848/g.16629 Transcript_4848/m.16629 type:complete len:104 (-) Transcript_4848:610-921(-)